MRHIYEAEIVSFNISPQKLLTTIVTIKIMGLMLVSTGTRKQREVHLDLLNEYLKRIVAGVVPI